MLRVYMQLFSKLLSLKKIKRRSKFYLNVNRTEHIFCKYRRVDVYVFQISIIWNTNTDTFRLIVIYFLHTHTTFIYVLILCATCVP